MAGVMVPLRVYPDNGSFALRAPRYINNRHLAANVAETMAVPTGAVYAFFSCSTTDSFAVAYDNTAVMPTADVTDGSAADLNPTVREVLGITNLSIVAGAATDVSVAFYGN